LAAAVRDLRVAPAVAALLPADLLAQLRAGPHPSTSRCAACQGAGNLAAGDATALLLRRYPRQAVRRVRLAHATCAVSEVGVAPDAAAEPELADGGVSVVHAGVLGTAAVGEGLARPFLALDNDGDLVTTDPRAPGDPDRLRPGELIDPAVSRAPMTGLVLLTSTRADPPPAPGWSLRIGQAPLDLYYPRADGRAGVERLSRRVPAAWRAAVRAAGDQVTLPVGRAGLSTATGAARWSPGDASLAPGARRGELCLPGPRSRATAPSSPISPAVTFAVLSAVAAGRVAAGKASVAWTRPC
jgi:hypothetical protein